MSAQKIVLNEQERESIIMILREEAITTVRKLGCTCDPEPQMALSEQVFGDYDLPAWWSRHEAPCPLDTE